MSNLFDSKLACGVVAAAGALAVGTITKYGCDAIGLSDRNNDYDSLADAPSAATLANLEKLEEELIKEVKKADQEQTAKVKEFEAKIKKLTDENAKLKKELEDINVKLGEAVLLLNRAKTDLSLKDKEIEHLNEKVISLTEEKNSYKSSLDALSKQSPARDTNNNSEQPSNPQPVQGDQGTTTTATVEVHDTTKKADKEMILLESVVNSICANGFITNRDHTWTVEQLTTEYDSTQLGGEKVFPALFTTDEKQNLLPSDELVDLIVNHPKFDGDVESFKDVDEEEVMFYTMLVLKDKAKEFKALASKYVGDDDNKKLEVFWITKWHEQILLIANIYAFFIRKEIVPEYERANRNKTAQIMRDAILHGDPKKGQVKVLDKVIAAVISA